MEESFYDIGRRDIGQRYGFSSSRDLKVLCVSWNSQSQIMCNKRNTNTMSGLLGSYECFQADFFDKLLDKINDKDIVIFSNQEDDYYSKQHTYFFTEMNKLGFNLVSNAEMLGYGASTLSTGRSRGLRISAFVKNVFITSEKTGLYKPCGGFIETKLLSNKGGVGVILTYKNITMLFCNLHLPFNSNSIKNLDTTLESHTERQNNVMKQNKCLNEVINDFVGGRPIDNIFIMGDLNYRLNPYVKNNNIIVNEKDKLLDLLRLNNYKKTYNRYDELLQELKKKNIVFNFHEGITSVTENYDLVYEGINFPPTCKMYNNKSTNIYRKFPTSRYTDKEENDRCTSYFDVDCYKMGKNTQRIPSYCDRILYFDINNENSTECNEYKSLSSKTINATDHNLIYGSFIIH